MEFDDGGTCVEHAASHFSATITETPLLNEEVEEWDRRFLTENRCQML